jgi:hypothetical protein
VWSACFLRMPGGMNLYERSFAVSIALAFKITFDVFTTAGPNNSLERLTQRRTRNRPTES